MTGQPLLRVILANPRGSCAGVERAIGTVEQALEAFGTPIYVHHEIVHNRFVVQTLEERGVVFVDSLDGVPDDAVVIFSAHGVSRAVRAEAASRGLRAIDATCPLVAKVHLDVAKHSRAGRQIVLIGHPGHAEVTGTLGQLAPGEIHLVQSAAEVDALELDPTRPVAYATQTTLAADDVRAMIAALKRRHPDVIAPAREDICFATTNRQNAVMLMAPSVERLLVLGAPHSSNARRLVEIARRHGCDEARLIERGRDIDWAWLGEPTSLGITAAASAPEVLVRETIGVLAERFDIEIETVTSAVEEVAFALPRELRDAEKLAAGPVPPGTVAWMWIRGGTRRSPLELPMKAGKMHQGSN